jgi:acyl-CoA synthetase (NDP forming)/GNAT superfamily N-acetyltransferase
MSGMHLPISDDPRGVDVLAADGTMITVRPVRSEDRSALARLHEDSSDQLIVRSDGSSDDAAGGIGIDRLCLSKTRDWLRVVAVAGTRIAGLARCRTFGPGGHTGEVSVLVAEPDRGRGIGMLLLENLTARAADVGMTRLLADALPGHETVISRSGIARPHTGDDPEPDEADVLRRTVDAHDRPTARALPRVLLEPRTVAVTGAMQQRGSTGFEMVRAIRDYGYTGRLYPVSESGRPVCGLPAYRSITDLPGPVDLLIVTQAAELVPAVLAEAGKHGIREIVLAADGVPEARRIAHENGIRLLGCGSLGMLNTDSRVRLNATLSPARPPAGSLALAAHSAAVGIAMLDHAARNGCGVSGFVSLGDTADLTYDDLMCYWHSDPGTRVVALHLDGLGAGGRFARTARALARRKPVLAIRSGRATADDLFTQAGIIRVADLDELTDVALLLADQPLPTGARLGVVGNAGGLGPLAAEAAQRMGFTVPRLSVRLRKDLPHGLDNPVDLGQAATSGQIAAAVDVVAGSGEIDVLLLPIIGTRANVPAAILTALATTLDRHTGLTTAVVLVGSADDIHRIGARHAPVYLQPGRALRALAHAHRYSRWRAEPLGRATTPGGTDPARARRLLAQADTGRRGWMPRATAVDVLAAYGITVLPCCHARTGVSAVAAAERLGYPVTIRPADDSATSVRNGADRRGLSTAVAVREAFDAMTRLGGPDSGVLVQHHLSAAMELTAGVRQMPGLGPVVEAGSDRHRSRLVRRIVPLTDVDAARMRHDLLQAISQAGRHTRPPVSTVAVEDLMLRLSTLADDHPEIAELQLSPLLAGANGVAAAHVRLRVRAVAASR